MFDDKELIEKDIEKYLEQHQNKELLRFTSVGSVDDGKSTLIGRLLHDTHGIYEDQLNAVKRASSQRGTEIDLSLLTDGLRAEREQGITIDVAYRYFSTARRKFIIADTPGHVQYTRNMATGASTANVAVILIDARLGVVQQSRRHAYIASLLGIPHLLVAVNKMDLKGYEQAVFESIREAFSRFATQLAFSDVTFLPISALNGDNVVHKSDAMPWWNGGTLLEFLETVPLDADRNLTDFRYPVQYVLRPHLDYRGFSGEIASGVVRPGDPVLVLPSRRTSRVKAIDTFEGERAEAFSPESVTIRLEDEVDVSRGDMLVPPDNVPYVRHRFDATIVWMSERSADLGKSYLLKHTTQIVRADIESIQHTVNLETLQKERADGLELNDIARITVCCRRSLYFDAYRKNRATGAFILIDSLTNNTVAAGMIEEPTQGTELDDSSDDLRTRSQVSDRERRERLGQRGATIWLTGPAGSGKTEVAYALERRLFDLGRVALVVDPGDALSTEGEPAQGVPAYAGPMARRNTTAGLFTIFAFTSPTQSERDSVRRGHREEQFIEVHVKSPAPTPPGAGAYEVPPSPAIHVSLAEATAERAAESIVGLLRVRGLFDES